MVVSLVRPDIIIDNGGTDWLTPVATVVAVVVGGFITWGVQFWHARRQERGQAKASARILQGDLAMAASRLQYMIERDLIWYGFYNLTLPNWNAQAPVVALHLDADTWEKVSQSALELDGLTEGFRRSIGADPPRGTIVRLSASSIADMRVLWQNASDAHRHLAALAEVPPEQGLLHEGAPAHHVEAVSERPTGED